MLSDLADRWRVPAAQLVVHHDGETRAEGDLDALFPAGSLTKPFTAALALTLVDDGDLELDRPLHELDLPVTLRQLLSHTSGLPSNVDDTGPSIRRWVARHGRHFVHRPGTVFSYSNAGYVVVGCLIEEVTGMPWREAIGSVLGVKSFVDTPGVLSGHVVLPERVVPVSEVLPAVEDPAGALALSAHDLLTFARHELVPSMCVDQLGGIAIGPFGLADGWGLGLARYGEMYGHDGTGDGTSCHLRIDPVSGTVVAFTSNASTGEQMWADVVKSLRDRGVVDRAPLPELGPPVPAPEDCFGRYANGGAGVVVRQVDDEVVLFIGARPHAVMTCHADLRFRLENGHEGRFLRDETTSRIEYMQISGRLAKKCGEA